MTRVEQMLLSNVLDSLDRLFDHQCTVADVCALLIATTEALRTTEYFAELERPIEDLRAALRSHTSPDAKRDVALSQTDQLRKYLAGLLQIE